MKTVWTFMCSGSARLFALLLLSALVPATTLDLLFTARARDMLTDQTHTAVVEQAKAYASTTYERLRNGDEALRLIAAEFGAKGTATPLLDQYAKPHFAAITHLNAAGQPAQIFGPVRTLPRLDDMARAHLARNDAVILTATAEGAPPRIILIRAANGTAAHARGGASERAADARLLPFLGRPE